MYSTCLQLHVDNINTPAETTWPLCKPMHDRGEEYMFLRIINYGSLAVFSRLLRVCCRGLGQFRTLQKRIELLKASPTRELDKSFGVSRHVSEF